MKRTISLILLALSVCLSWGQVPTSPGLTKTQAAASFSSNWVTISTNPGQCASAQSSGAGSSYCQTTRSLFYLPTTIPYTSDLRVGFLNAFNFSSGSQLNYTPGPNTLKIRCTLWKSSTTGPANQVVTTDYPLGEFTFGGNAVGVCGRGKMIWGELHGVTLVQGQAYYIHAEENCALAAAPSAPTVAASGTGSYFPGGSTYYISITYVFPNGEESIASAYSSGVAPTVGQNIVVTSPSNPGNGAIGYRCFMSLPGNNTTTYLAYDANGGIVPFGTNATLTYPVQSNNQGWMEGVYASGSSQTIIWGSPVFGGTNIGGRGSGEGSVANVSISGGSRNMPGSTNGNGFAPNVIQCLSPVGNKPSWGLTGDSILDGTGDNGYGANGYGCGYFARAILNQTSLQYSPSTIPAAGYTQCSVGGDTAKAVATNQGLSRSMIAGLNPRVGTDLGTNDLSNGAAPTINALITIGQRFTTAGKTFYHTGLLPRGGTSDAYQTIANQTLSVGGQAEATRRTINNWLNDTFIQGGRFSAQFGFGNGSSTTFYFPFPLVSQSYTITVNGSAATYAASPSGALQYSETGSTSIGSNTFVTGITFGSAPAANLQIVVTSASSPVLPMFKQFSGSAGPSATLYGFGDGSATVFYFNHPILQGSEAITNNGTLCTYNASPSGQNQYSYLYTQSINGSTYVSGVTFGSAPTNGNPITYTGTKLAGFSSLLGSNAVFLNGPLCFGELNGAGNLQMNGGFCPLSQAPVVGTIASPHSLTATSSTGFTDTSLGTLTQDQYSGYCVAIIADSVTPAAAGQIQCIGTNTTAGVFTCGSWTTQPSTSAQYVILLSPMQTSTHPSSYGHANYAAALRTYYASLFP